MLSPDAENIVKNEIAGLYPEWNPSATEIAVWVNAVRSFEIGHVRQGVSRYYSSKDGQYKRPKIFHVMKHCRAVRSETVKNTNHFEPYVLFYVVKGDTKKGIFTNQEGWTLSGAMKMGHDYLERLGLKDCEIEVGDKFCEEIPF